MLLDHPDLKEEFLTNTLCVCFQSVFYFSLQIILSDIDSLTLFEFGSNSYTKLWSINLCDN